MSLLEEWEKLVDFLRVRKRDYTLTFRKNLSGQAVLRDLAPFCRANTTCYHPEEFMRGVLTGRREVWLRIQHHLNMTEEELATLYSGRSLKPKEDDHA